MALPGNKNFSDYDNYITDQNPTTSAQAQDYFRNQAELLKAVIDCDFWQPETVYQPGDVVKSDSMPNGTEAVMVATKASVTSNIEPQWGAVGGANISDGACFWKLRWQHWSKDVEQITDLTTGATNRLPNTTYTDGNVVYNKSNLSVALKCTQAGTTSNTELDISNKVVGESVADGSVVWKVVKRDLSEEVRANTDNFANYLSLSGGVMKGVIKFLLGARFYEDENGIHLNSEYTNCGKFTLRRGNDVGNPGGFQLRAMDANGKTVYLIGYADGRLTWDGKDITNNFQYYTKSGNGYAIFYNYFVIAWGLISGSGVITKTKPIAFDTIKAFGADYASQVTEMGNDIVTWYSNEGTTTTDKFHISNGGAANVLWIGVLV